MPAVNKLATICWRVGDVFCIDGIMVNGTAKTVGFVALQLRKIQTGYLYHYAFAMITGFFVLLLWFMILH
jgi:NADH-quinone oxidoreductase subunit L